MGGSPRLAVMGGDLHSRGRFFHIIGIVVKIILFV